MGADERASSDNSRKCVQLYGSLMISISQLLFWFPLPLGSSIAACAALSRAATADAILRALAASEEDVICLIDLTSARIPTVASPTYSSVSFLLWLDRGSLILFRALFSCGVLSS